MKTNKKLNRAVITAVLILDVFIIAVFPHLPETYRQDYALALIVAYVINVPAIIVLLDAWFNRHNH